MKKSYVLMLLVAGLTAQGPPPGGPGGPRGGFGPGFGILSAGPGSRKPVVGAPYSGVEVMQSHQTLGDGNQIARQEQSKVYRDGQGRVRMERTMNPPGSQTPQTTITIFDPVAGYSYVLNPATTTATQMAIPAPDSMRDGRHGPPPGGRNLGGKAQLQTENLGTQTINGVPATGTRNTETIAAGAIGNQQPIQIVRETWVSIDLKVPVQIKTSDPRFGNMNMQLTNIVQGEPDASLFQVPQGYTVKTRTQRPGRPGMR